MPERVQLNIPLIGNLAPVLKLINVFPGTDENQTEVEKTLHQCLQNTGKLEKILSFLFPRDVKSILDKKNWEDTLFTYPLLPSNHTRVPQHGNIHANMTRRSVWADLMYDLGKFSLADKTDFSRIQSTMPHIYKKDGEWKAWSLNIENASGILKDIWSRLTAVRDVQIVFIDDDADFMDHFLGEGENGSCKKVDCHQDDFVYDNTPLIFLDTGKPYDQHKVQNKVEKIIDGLNERDTENNDKLLVFVVDLLFEVDMTGGNACTDVTDKEFVNSIKGDDLIKYIRTKKPDSLVIGFTNGTSPFIINSAEKAGADIVLFKKRGGESAHHGGGGNAVGTFDLLWAISWNVSVWRLLKASQKKHMEGKDGNFKNLVLDFFPDLENISPFWKAYLEKWKMQINNEKIKNLFK